MAILPCDAEAIEKPADLSRLYGQAILAPTTVKLQTIKTPKIAETVPASFSQLDGAYHFTFTQLLQPCHSHSQASFPNLCDIHSGSPFPGRPACVAWPCKFH
jgi:hypothetical protein